MLLESARGVDDSGTNGSEDSVNLRSQLEGLTLLTLQDLAAKEGISPQDMSRARLSADPRSAFVQVLLSKS
jgi:hypothetical protein